MGDAMKTQRVIIFAALLVLVGCAHMQELSDDVMQKRKSGSDAVTKVYPVSAGQAWEISEAVFRWEKTDELDVHRSENYMITSTGMKMLAFGSVMGVWIEPADSDSTKVTVITSRRVENDFFTSLTASTFFERFEQGMKIIKDGGKLPVAAPAN